LAVAVPVAVLALGVACAQGNLPRPVQAAVQDLSERIDVPAEMIVVASMEQVTWPDTSLGNPQPGQFYAQVQTEGYRVILEAQGQRYEYHTDMGTRLAMVEETEVGSGPIPAGEDETPARLATIRAAKADLAARLQIAPEAVYLLGLERVTWPDASLGAPEPGQDYAQVLTPGYRLVLEADGSLYSYHADKEGHIVASGGVPPADQDEPTPPGEVGDLPAATGEAIADLAARLGIAQGDVSVVSVEAVQWPNGALGLPEPGMMYAQAVVPGHRIILQAGPRRFEYHSGQGPTPLFAGVVYPEDAAVSVLSLLRTEPADGNNFFHLQRIEPYVEVGNIVTEFISDFAVTPDGRDIAVKKRTSRSSHEVARLLADGTVAAFDGAFDFFGLAWDSVGSRLAYWGRPMPGNEVNLVVWTMGSTTPTMPPLPNLRPGAFRPGKLAWTNDGLAITVTPEGAGGPRSLFWDGQSTQELGDYAILGWIPRTSSLLARKQLADGTQQLVTVIPGRGEGTVLLAAQEVLAAAAPAEGQYVLVASRSGDDGVVQVSRVTWGGQSQMVAMMVDVSEVAVAISPVGDIATVSYVVGEVAKSDVLAVGAEEPLITSIMQPGPAIPVAE